MRLLMAALVVTVGLAGCADEAPAAPTSTAPPPGSSQPAPVWELGDWWSYLDSTGAEFSVAAAAQDGGDWLFLTNDFSKALLDYNIDISWMGKMRKSDLAGMQGTDRVLYFDWPLEHGKTWTSPWDGATATLVSHGMEEGKWHISVEQGGTDFAEYVYNPITGWLDTLIFYNTTDGSLLFGMETTGNGSDYTGTVYQYDSVEILEDISIGAATSYQGQFSVREEIDEMFVSYNIECNGSGIIGAGMQEPNEDGTASQIPPTPIEIIPGPAIYGNFGNCPEVGGPGSEFIESARPGVWRVDAVVANQGSLEFTVEGRSYTGYRL